jgi:hypothetical protein
VGNTIDINGKRYDAFSGALLGDSPIASVATTRPHAAHQGRVIDGFVKKKPTHSPSVKAPVHAPKTAVPAQPLKAGVAMEPVKKKKPLSQRAPAKTATPRQPEKAKTLMRSVVHKPAVNMKTAIKTQAASEIAAAPVSELVPQLKKAAHIVDDSRLARAQQTGRSNYVRRFTSLQQNYPVSRARNVSAAAVAQPATQVAKITVQAAPEKRQTSKANDLFEAAIANAHSHEQPKVKAKRSTRQKFVGITAGVAAFLVLSGFIAYTNMSNIEMRLASVRVGFSVQLPNYAPTGYALQGGVQAKSSIATATYRSGDSSYTLQQQTSDWDSQTLYDNVVAISSEQHQKLSASGQTIYVYGHSAAWVNGGVLYSLKTDGNISNQEILSIASSI